MKPLIYLDTSIISYLTAPLSRDLIIAAHQQITQEWWMTGAGSYELYVSELVWNEVQEGDAKEARKRMDLISPFTVLPLNEVAETLGQTFIQKHALPTKAITDALHIAIATVHGMDYLMTWNLKHMVNPVIQKSLRRLIEANGYNMPTICTPEVLLRGEK